MSERDERAWWEIDPRCNQPWRERNTIDHDDALDGSEGGFDAHGNRIPAGAMREIVMLRHALLDRSSVAPVGDSEATSDFERHVYRALALVDRSLESEEGMRSVQQQTGGTAPEIVQGILDRIAQLYARLRAPVDPGDHIEFPLSHWTALIPGAPVDLPYTTAKNARFCNQGGCKDSWHVGGNYGSHVCRNPAHHDAKPVDPPERVKVIGVVSDKPNIAEALARVAVNPPERVSERCTCPNWPYEPDEACVVAAAPCVERVSEQPYETLPRVMYVDPDRVDAYRFDCWATRGHHHTLAVRVERVSEASALREALEEIGVGAAQILSYDGDRAMMREYLCDVVKKVKARRALEDTQGEG